MTVTAQTATAHFATGSKRKEIAADTLEPMIFRPNGQSWPNAAVLEVYSDMNERQKMTAKWILVGDRVLQFFCISNGMDVSQ